MRVVTRWPSSERTSIGSERRIVVSFGLRVRAPFASVKRSLMRRLPPSTVCTNVSPVTHFPVPKPPGIAAVPPFAIGKRKSRTRWPVTSGMVGMSRSRTGRARRTGHVWTSFTCSPLSSWTTTSSTLNVPSLSWATFPPRKFGGTMIRCSTFFASCTVPTTSPGATAWPCFTFGLNLQDFSLVSPGDFTPRRMKSPITFWRIGSGRWTPSYMLPRSPGPSSTTRGAPVSRTTSPGLTPLVSSYTWMTVLSPMIWMTSPRSCSSPTNWTSYIRGRSPVAVTTGPATRKISPVPFPATPLSVCFIVIVRAPCSNHLYRSTPIARLIFSRRSSSSRLPTAITTGRGVVSRRCRRPWLRAFMSSALKIRIPTFESSRTFATCDSRFSGLTLKVLRTPASLNPWTNSSRPTAASSISYPQELSDHFRGQAALLSPGDDPKVLDLAVFPHDVVEDDQDGQRVDVCVPARLEKMELFDRSDQLPDAHRLEVLQLRGKVLRERVVSKTGRETVHVQRHHLREFRGGNLEASFHKGVVRQRGLRCPETQEGFHIHDVDLAADEFPHEASPLRPLRHHGEEVFVVELRNEVFPFVPLRDLGGFLP